MGLTVPAAFSAAEQADSALLSQQVFLLLGNYANSRGYGATATSSGDFSTDYPAAGAIDGDRTEINIGAATAADNGIGASSWKSASAPDSGVMVWLKIDLAAQRTFNRLKLYHRAGHGLKSFIIEASIDDATYFTIAATSDFTGGGQGWGEGGWGDGPWGGSGGGAPTPASFVTTMQLDTIDLPADVTYRYVRITVANTQVANDKAEIVELEVYRKLDITDKTRGIDIDRQQDYKLKNELASTCTLDLSNTDRFFSRQYSPTAAEIAAGFVNSELRPGLGIIVELGFYGINVATFTGTVDTINTVSRSRGATIAARDGIKGLINNVVSTKLKTGADIGTNIQYLLNLANVSNYEMSVDTTNITLDYFFTYSTSILTTIQQLAQACGDANFRFSETGVASFKMYMNNFTSSATDSSQADFQSGTLVQNIDTTTTPGQISASWSLGGTWTISSDQVNHAKFVTAGGGNYYVFGSTTGVQMNGYAQGTIYPTSGDAYLFFGQGSSGNLLAIRVTSTATQVVRITTGLVIFATYINVAHTPSANDVYKLTNLSNALELFINGVSVGTGTWEAGAGALSPLVEILATGAATFSKISYKDATGAALYSFDPIFESRVMDMTTAITALETLSSDFNAPGASSVTWYTATSADGVTFDAWVAAAPGSPIASTLHRYIKYRAVLNVAASVSGATTPIIYDVSVSWTTGSGSTKYPSSVSYTFRYDGALLELEEESTDDLGGDTAILNSIQVQSTPLVLSGADTDTQWQATANAPAASVSAGNPIVVTPGTYTYLPVIPGGMDISRMTGASPAAAVVTFGGGAVGSWTFTNIHPTTPTLTVTITVGGTITDLRLIGKAFSSSQTPILAQASDTQSIALYDKRNYPLTNNYLINSGVALSVANRVLANSKDPALYIKSARVQPTWSIQNGDRCTMVDDNSGVAADYIVAEVRHRVRNSGSVEAYTELKLMSIV